THGDRSGRRDGLRPARRAGIIGIRGDGGGQRGVEHDPLLEAPLAARRGLSRPPPTGDYIMPSSSRADSDIMLGFQGGSKTTSTMASRTPGTPSILPCASAARTPPMPQPGAVSVSFTSARWPPLSSGVTAHS